MIDELSAIAGAAAVEMRPVHDLWPLKLMRERAGEPSPDVPCVTPTTYAQVGEILAWAARSGHQVIPVGGESGVCGAVDVAENQVALRLTGLDSILEVDGENLVCRVQAGVIGKTLEDHLLGLGLTLGHYPSSLPVSTIGGLISTRSSGQQSTYYGSIEHLVLGVSVALPDGSLLPALPQARSAVGPALQQVLVGAEGALGVVVEATLRVQRLPEEVLGRGFAFSHLSEALDAMQAIHQLGIRPLVVRVYDPDDTAFQAAGVEGCLMVVAVAGAAGVASAQMAVVERCCRGGAELGPDPWSRWLDRRFELSAERLREFLKPAGSMVDTIEVAARWSSLLPLYQEVRSELQQAGLALCHFSHGDAQGCCAYFTFGGSAGTEDQAQETYRRCWEGAMQACLRHGATISHHHGVGQVRSRWARQELGGWWRVWEALREGLDPVSVMNPRGVGGR